MLVCAPRRNEKGMDRAAQLTRIRVFLMYVRIRRFNLPLSPSYTLEWGGGWATAGTERGYPEPFVLLEPPAQNPGCCCVVA